MWERLGVGGSEGGSEGGGGAVDWKKMRMMSMGIGFCSLGIGGGGLRRITSWFRFVSEGVCAGKECLLPWNGTLAGLRTYAFISSHFGKSGRGKRVFTPMEWEASSLEENWS